MGEQAAFSEAATTRWPQKAGIEPNQNVKIIAPCNIFIKKKEGLRAFLPFIPDLSKSMCLPS